MAELLEMPENRIKQRLFQMSKDGEVRVVSRGRYELHNISGVEERGYLPGGTFFGGRVVILRAEQSSRPTEKERRDRRMTDGINKAAEDHCPGGLFVCSECVEPFVGFLNAACKARSRDKEWDAR